MLYTCSKFLVCDNAIPVLCTYVEHMLGIRWAFVAYMLSNGWMDATHALSFVAMDAS